MPASRPPPPGSAKSGPTTRAAAEREIGGCPWSLEQGLVRRASESRTARRAGPRVHPMERLRVGIVGSGFAANLHADAWKRVAGIDVSIIAVAAGHPHTAAAFAGRHGIEKAVPNVERLLADPDVDVV